MRSTFFVLAFSLLIGACGNPLVRLEYDSSVPSSQKNQLESDLSFLREIQITDHTDAAIFGVSDFSSESLRVWLSDRLKVIIGENFSESNVKEFKTNFSYAPTTYSLLSMDPVLNASVTVMSNEGGGWYRTGKKENKVYSVQVAGTTKVIDSPRVGIAQIGEGLFREVKGVSLSSPAAMLIRVATLFHEARHSDGNGAHVCFPHKKCATGTYSGPDDGYACDQYANGPYKLEEILMRKFRSACTKCSREDLAALDASIADNVTRPHSTSPTADPRPERIQP